MNVKMILKEKGRQVHTVKPSALLGDVAEFLTKARIGAVVVVSEAGEVIGILSERDIVRAVAEDRQGAPGHAVQDYMTTDVTTCGPNDSIDELMSRMTDRRIRHLPVLESGKLIGLVSIGDLVKMRIAETELEAQSLRQYIAAS
jgi:CBS domain-containing protein